MGTLSLVTAPAAEPVLLAEAKIFLRVTISDDDTLITNMIAAARQLLDGDRGMLGRALINQTWLLTRDGFPACDEIRLPLPPLSSVTSVKYLDLGGASQTLSTDIYGSEGDEWSGRVYLKNNQLWPTALAQAGSVQITFVCGYGATSSNVPEPLRQEILSLIAGWYDDRSTAGRIPDGWSSAYRVNFPVAA